MICQMLFSLNNDNDNEMKCRPLQLCLVLQGLKSVNCYSTGLSRKCRLYNE